VGEQKERVREIAVTAASASAEREREREKSHIMTDLNELMGSPFVRVKVSKQCIRCGRPGAAPVALQHPASRGCRYSCGRKNSSGRI